METKIFKLPFKVAPQEMKYLDINLTKHAEDLSAENYKTLRRTE